MLKLWWYRLTTKRIEIVYVSFREANNLMKSDPKWKIAKEEDNNPVLGFVFMERRE